MADIDSDGLDDLLDGWDRGKLDDSDFAEMYSVVKTVEVVNNTDQKTYRLQVRRSHHTGSPRYDVRCYRLFTTPLQEPWFHTNKEGQQVYDHPEENVEFWVVDEGEGIVNISAPTAKQALKEALVALSMKKRTPPED